MEPPHPTSSLDAVKRPLTELEVGVIDLFVNAVRVLGLPKSIGEIYGLLYLAQEPLSFDDILSRLQISKGSTSQGLKFLRSLGAVKAVYTAGSRRDYFVAETELKKLVGGFIREELTPHLENGANRVENLQSLLEPEERVEGAFLGDRIRRLENWHRRSHRLLPLIEKFLS